jgi:hypothetical protein
MIFPESESQIHKDTVLVKQQYYITLVDGNPQILGVEPLLLNEQP